MVFSPWLGVHFDREDLSQRLAAAVLILLALLVSQGEAGQDYLTAVQFGGCPANGCGGAEVSSLLAAGDVSLEFSAQSYALRIDRISPIVDRTTRTHEVRLGFADRAAPVGASGRITWTERNPGLPADLLVQREGKLGVFVVEGSTARFVDLPGAVEGRPAAVALAPDTLIVTSGRHNLRPGDSITLEP